MPTVSTLPRQRSGFGASPNAATSAILGQLEALDNVLRLSLKPNQAAVPPAAAAAPEPVQPDFATAFDLLGRASEAMDVLQSRCTELENAAKVRGDHFKMALDVAHEQIRQSEGRAAAFELRLGEKAALGAAAEQRAAAAEQRATEADHRAQAAEERAETAEERVVDAEHRSEAAEQRAAAAERSAADASEWLKSYYERIIHAFGMRGQAATLQPVG